MKLEEAWRELETRMDDPPSEIHIVNGLHPGPAVLVLRGAARRLQAHQARHPHEVLHRGGDPLLRPALRDDATDEVLERLRRAGLDSLPGGGAEIFHPEVRSRISHDKATADEYLEVHRVAHRLGHAHERDDALRAHRDLRAPRRPPAPPARAAGRDRRAPGVHPARLPPRRQRHEEPARRPPRSTPCARSPCRASCSTTSRTSRPTGSA